MFCCPRTQLFRLHVTHDIERVTLFSAGRDGDVEWPCRRRAAQKATPQVVVKVRIARVVKLRLERVIRVYKRLWLPKLHVSPILLPKKHILCQASFRSEERRV